MAWSHKGPTITKRNDYVSTSTVKYVETLQESPISTSHRQEHCAFCEHTQRCKRRHPCNSLLGRQQCTFLMLRFFTQKHRAIITPVSQAYTDVMSREERMWGQNKRSREWYFHPTCFHHDRSHGLGSYTILKASHRSNIWKCTAKPLHELGVVFPSSP